MRFRNYILIAIVFILATVVFAEAPTTQPATRPRAATADILFEGVPLTEAIEYFRNTTRANIFVNWNKLESEGIDRNHLIDLRVRNITFAKALHLVLESVDPRLNFTVSEGVISIYVAQFPPDPASLRTQVYDLTDLGFPVPDFQDLTSRGNEGRSNTNRSNGAGGSSNRNTNSTGNR